MNRREFLKQSAATSIAAAALQTAGAEPATGKKLNVLYVFSDQHRAQSLPGEPFNQAEAPSLDRFRRQNLSMDSCISNYPLCVPHRGILISGLYPNQSHVVGNENSLEPIVPGLGETFQKAGYHTGYVGKWHLFHGEGQFVPKGPYRFGFEDWHAWANTNKHYDGITFDQETGERQIMPGYQPTRMTDQAVDFINGQKNAAKPWFLVVSWNPPHPPYDPPAEERDRYDAAALKLRPNVRMPIPADKIVNPWPALKSLETLHQAEQGYYGAITAIDKEFARLLKALEDNGMADNTMVIYTSDHGEMMGSHGHMAKQMPHEESCRVPFFLRHPEGRQQHASDTLFASVDIYPTLCGLAGIPVPKHCSGRDVSTHMLGKRGFQESEMVFLMNNQGPANRQEIDTPTYRGIRTKTHTYAVQLDGRWVLYDNVADPYQMKNLVQDPANKDMIAKFDAALIAWSKETGDDFPYESALKSYSSYPGN
ncbi:sulfatase family protein [Silvibacterium acidisoli]|uniref:sulfatase family protein n=1 Tax=Acidobacteriaceae bacterium ZG23-2 TaxID=2883246 RepID=UPI00406C8210